MASWINYHHLLYFKTIAEMGSVSLAAKKLHLGQPTLSAQLKQLEASLGVLLFERQHKKLILTEHGKLALDYSKSIFKMGSEMIEVLQDRSKPLKPYLHLGALDSVPKQIVLQLVQKALDATPCQITLSEGKLDELLRELTSHQMDLLVTNHLPIGLGSKGLYPKLITKKNVSLYAAPKFKTLKKGFPKSISGQPMILPTYDSRLRQDIEHWSKLYQIDLSVTTESQDISLQKMMAASEIGLIPAALHTVAGQVRRGELVEIGLLDGVFEELYLVTANRKVANSIAADLMETFAILKP